MVTAETEPFGWFGSILKKTEHISVSALKFCQNRPNRIVNTPRNNLNYFCKAGYNQYAL
ncbi:hypothetical protein Hanom_Chr15g01405371 [Helianthus anomalus]